MFDFVNFAAAKLQLFLLIMLRASGLFLVAPILSHTSFPMMAKVGMVILFSIILVTTLGTVTIPPVASLGDLVAMAAKELFVGIAIGFVFAMLLMAVQGAGDIVSYQMGLSMATIVDPRMGQVSILGQFWFLCATLVFLTINGHHVVISAFNDSYLLIPPGKVVMNGSVAEMMMTYSAYVFVIAIKVAAPVIITVLLVDVALGVVARMMPTMNVFILGFGVKVGVGLLVMAFSLPAFAYVLEKATSYLNEQVHTMLAVLGKA